MKKLITLFLITVLVGCESIKENAQWAQDNKDRIKEVIELVKEIPFSPAGPTIDYETKPKAYVSNGQTLVDNPPPVEVYAIIDSELLYQSIQEVFPGVDFDPLADGTFAILTLDSIEQFIPWTQRFAQQIGFVYGSESLDCDNFARGFRGAVKFALAKSSSIEAEALCATIWVKNQTPWAGVADGAHALNAIPYYDTAPKRFGILVVEPQNGTYTDLSQYPNKEYIYQITVSGG